MGDFFDTLSKEHKAGFVLKTDTLLKFRQMAYLTPQAFAGELGLSETRYLKYEEGIHKTPFILLKSALNVVRIIYKIADGKW